MVLQGKYRVIEMVARGGMGRIYRAEHTPLGREVALKILTRPMLGGETDDAALQKRFLLEAATCARLKHPNTVRVFDYGAIQVSGDPTFFMVMEFLRGRTLAQAIRADGPFSPARALRVAIEICRSLREAHKAGVVHRDLKPSNVMLTEGDEGEAVKVLDFGVAKVLSGATEALTSDGSFVGSPRYTAPEQIRQDKVDGRADLYAVGVVIYEMLTGIPPFTSSEPVRTLLMHLNDPVPPFPAALGVPSDVEQLVRRLMEKRPEDRFDSAEVTTDALRRLRAQLGPELLDLAAEPTWEEEHLDARSVAPLRTGSHAGLAQTEADSGESVAEPRESRRGGAPWMALGAGIGALFAVAFAALGVALWLASQNHPSFTPNSGDPVLQDALAGMAAAPTTSTVVLDSAPAGAGVFVNGMGVGLTPYTLTFDPTDPPKVEVRAPGFAVLMVDPATLVGRPAPLALTPMPPVAPPTKSTPPVRPASAPRANDDILLER